jgi:hypothetical protein
MCCSIKRSVSGDRLGNFSLTNQETIENYCDLLIWKDNHNGNDSLGDQCISSALYLILFYINKSISPVTFSVFNMFSKFMIFCFYFVFSTYLMNNQHFDLSSLSRP